VVRGSGFARRDGGSTSSARLLAPPHQASPGSKRWKAAAILAWGDGDAPSAQILAAEAVRICRDLHSEREHAHALLTFGASTDGDQSAMAAACSEAMQLFEHEGDVW
jgi:hypothetical protein